jgi:anti-sigma factor RsiW
MKDLKLQCSDMDEKLADLLFEPAAVPAEVHQHLTECEHCRRELDELKATMTALEAWQAPEPSPFFVTRVNARVREQRQVEPAGWLAGLRARFAQGPRANMRPLAAMALTVLLLVGGGTYLSVTNSVAPAPQPNTDAAVVNDLQTLENNAQLLDTLENLSAPSDNGNSGSWEQ